jgi:hypothetical protein
MTTVTKTESRIQAAKPERRSELDLMEGLVVAGLVFFHTAMVFGAVDFYVKNDSQSVVVDCLLYSFGLWAMPLLFLSSGSAIWHSLRKRTTLEFVENRFRRLFVPFVAGLFVIFPPIVYYMLKADDPTFSAPYSEFYLNFVKFILDWPLFIVRPPFPEGERTGHLWFLIHLFVFTLILLPLFLYLRKPAGRRLADGLASLCARPGAIFLLGLPIAAIEAALATEPTGMWNRYTYVLFLAYGFLFAVNARFGDTLRRHWKSGLILGLLLLFTVGIGGFAALFGADIDPFTNYGLLSVLWRLCKGMNGWLMVVAILGLARRARQPRALQTQQALEANHDARPQPLRRKPASLDRVAEYVSEAQLPFYILHMTSLVVIGFYVVQWEINAFLKYIVISLASFVITLVVYDIGVRRTRLTRFLFGIRETEAGS